MLNNEIWTTTLDPQQFGLLCDSIPLFCTVTIFSNQTLSASCAQDMENCDMEFAPACKFCWLTTEFFFFGPIFSPFSLFLFLHSFFFLWFGRTHQSQTSWGTLSFQTKKGKKKLQTNNISVDVETSQPHGPSCVLNPPSMNAFLLFSVPKS